MYLYKSSHPNLKWDIYDLQKSFSCHNDITLLYVRPQDTKTHGFAVESFIIFAGTLFLHVHSDTLQYTQPRFPILLMMFSHSKM